MLNSKKIAIYGAGGFGREVAWLLSMYEKHQGYSVVGYIDDNAHGQIIHGKPVLSWSAFSILPCDSLVTIAIGNPKTRKKIAVQCMEAGYSFATLVHHSVEMSKFIELGIGSIICCGSILTVDIKIEQHVHINLGCTVGHDVRIGEFTTLSPGVHVSGNVHIGKNVYIGTGANIINGAADNPLVIADGTVIAAGACVTKSTEPNRLYAGVPAEFKKHCT